MGWDSLLIWQMRVRDLCHRGLEGESMKAILRLDEGHDD